MPSCTFARRGLGVRFPSSPPRNRSSRATLSFVLPSASPGWSSRVGEKSAGVPRGPHGGRCRGGWPSQPNGRTWSELRNRLIRCGAVPDGVGSRRPGSRARRAGSPQSRSGSCVVSVGGFEGTAQPAGPSLPGQGRLRRRYAMPLRGTLDLRASTAPPGRGYGQARGLPPPRAAPPSPQRTSPDAAPHSFRRSHYLTARLGRS